MKLPKCFKIKCNEGHPLWNDFVKWIELNENVVRTNPVVGYACVIINYKKEDIGNLPKYTEISLEDWKNNQSKHLFSYN